MRARVTSGGWDGQEPDLVAALFAGWLRAAGAEVQVTDTLACFDDPGRVAAFDPIVPVRTKAEIGKEQALNVCAAVAAGTGIAGCHGGMYDAFRANVDWHFLTGSQWIAHPGRDGVRYGVRMVSDDPHVAGIGDFEVATEQHYLHVDPAVRVLAVTDCPVADGPHAVNGPVAMPVAYTKGYGLGRVCYNALGHKAAVIADGPPAEMLRRGLAWAARRA